MEIIFGTVCFVLAIAALVASFKVPEGLYGPTLSMFIVMWVCSVCAYMGGWALLAVILILWVLLIADVLFSKEATPSEDDELAE